MIKEIQHLSASYNPGADLWIVPASPNNSWFKKLNWYCSSQLTLWNYKLKPKFSEKLTHIIESESLPFKDHLQTVMDDVLVDTTNIFPNRAVLAIDVSKGLNSWLNQLKLKSDQLKTYRIRIFWGQNQINDLIEGLNNKNLQFDDLSIEIVTCEPDKL